MHDGLGNIMADNKKRTQKREKTENKIPKENVQKSRSDEQDFFILEGKNVVKECLRSNSNILKILVPPSSNNESIKEIISTALDKNIEVHETEASELDRISQTKKHQGVIAFVKELTFAALEDALELAEKKSEKPFLVVLDHIEDPQNLGAIIRTAECSGAHGVIIPNRRAAGITSTVAKAASGALSHIPIVQVSNIASTLDKLKELGLWIYCADMDGASVYTQELSAPAAVVIGSEGRGVSELVRKKCDFVMSIPMLGNIPSLNASVAAAVILYEFVRQKLY